MVYFLDTNIFVRLVMREDKEITRQCEEISEKVRLGELEGVTSSLVLAEVGWLLKSYYQFPRLKVVESLRGMLNLSGLKFKGESNLRLALDLYAKFNVKLTDALIAAIPEIYSKKWVVVSYDEDFKKLPMKWKFPKDII